MGIEAIYRFIEELGYSHPLHPILVHLTIGLVIATLLFSLLSTVPRYSKYAVTARHCATMAFFSVFPTALLGVMDWLYYYGGSLIHPIEMKIYLASALGVLLLLAIVLHLRFTSRSPLLIAIYLFAVAAVTGLGYFGGELVFSGSSGGSSEESAEGEAGAAGEGGPVVFSDLEGVLQDHCVQCHRDGNSLEGLNLSSYEKTMEGSDNGPIVEPGEPDESELIKRLKGISQPRMPMSGPSLSEGQIQRFEAWIEAGAPETASDAE